MKFYEALRLMTEGERKITYPNWTENGYIYYKKDFLCIEYCSDRKNFVWLPNSLELVTDQWEIYE